MSGWCFGGPGQLKLTVHTPASNGTYRVDVTGTRMASGSRWYVHVQTDPAGEREFHRRAVDGGWSLTYRDGPIKGAIQPVVRVLNLGGGDRSHGCVVSLSTMNPTAAVAFCTRINLAYAAARRLNDGALVIEFETSGGGAYSRWHIELTATGSGTSQSVAFNAVSDRRGVVRSRAKLRGVDHPRLRVVATSGNDGRCGIVFEPPAM